MCFRFTGIFPPTPSSSMARPLPLNHLLLQSTFSSSTSQVGFAVMSIFLCAFALLMCASHSMKRRRQSWSSWFFGEDPEPVIEIQNEAPAVLPVTTSSEAARSQQLEASIWQKNILMGGKCQLPDFSGVIIYDSEGNIVTPSKAPRPLLLTWK